MKSIKGVDKMKSIIDVDKNFQTKNLKIDGKTAFYTIPSAPFDLYGITYLNDEKRFARLPETLVKDYPGLDFLRKHTSGGRIRFSTDSDFLTLTIDYPTLGQMKHMPSTGISGFSLLEESNGKEPFLIANFCPEPHETNIHPYVQTIALPKGKRNYVLYFPLYQAVNSLTIGVNANAYIGHGLSYKPDLPILYYGSSITQGGCATRPDLSYQAMISKWTNVDFINMGFSGNAKGEQFMAEYLSNIPCSVFVIDYDHNAPNPQHLKDTHSNFYKIFREKNPLTPVIFVTKPDFEYDVDAKKRVNIIKNTYLKAKAKGENVYFINGKSLYGKADRNMFAVDGCHPNDLGFYKMAKRILKELNKIK